MQILVGLGNIGSKYTLTRHNIGFIFLDQIVEYLEEKTGTKLKWEENSKLKASTLKFQHAEETYLLAKPTTLMNRSGESVSAILAFFKEEPKNLTVIYDDVDLPLGKIRHRDKGSAGTHNGMKSIISKIGTEEFKRIRIGIESRGTHAPAQQDLSSFVLTNFTNNEASELGPVIYEQIKQIFP